MLLKDVVREEIARGKIVLFSSHQMNYIEEFCDHIDDEDFFLVYGNPVIIKAESGTKLLAIAFSLYERYMRILGRGDEIDVIKKECAEAYKREK